MQLTIYLKNETGLLPMKGDTIHFHTPVALKVVERTEDKVVFEVTRIADKLEFYDVAETLTDARSTFEDI